MTTVEGEDAVLLEPGDPQRVGAATTRLLPAHLTERNAQGLVNAADLHVAALLARLSGPGQEPPADAVLEAVADAVAAAREGSSCVEVEDAEVREALAHSPLVGLGPEPGADQDGVERGRPLRLVDDLLYLDRFWRQERRVRDLVLARSAEPVWLDEAVLAASLKGLFPGPAPDRQRVAVARAVGSGFSVVAGGPGTGKTTTVARILVSLLDQRAAAPQGALPLGPLRVALAAPTGKAAARLQSAVAEQMATLLGDFEPYRAGTLHRLIGLRPGGTPRFHRDNPLPHDVVVVDETSMVSLPMLVRVLDAVRPDARLVLVGDPDQLASVEVGAVLADLVERPVDPETTPPAMARVDRVVAADVDADPRSSELHLDGRRGLTRLTRGYRFGGAIAEVADAVRRGDAAAVLDLVTSSADVRLLPPERAEEVLRPRVVDQARRVWEAAQAGDARTALDATAAHQLLTAHRVGPAGAARWATLARRWAGTDVPGYGMSHTGDPQWFVGRTVLVTRNDDDTGLANGDTGVTVRWEGEHRAGDARAGIGVAFDLSDGVKMVHPGRLPEVLPLAAMTVHRSQGSQYRDVGLVLPEVGSTLLTRELLYTAITRAQESVVILGTPEALEEAVRRPARRASGLRRDSTWRVAPDT